MKLFCPELKIQVCEELESMGVEDEDLEDELNMFEGSSAVDYYHTPLSVVGCYDMCYNKYETLSLIAVSGWGEIGEE